MWCLRSWAKNRQGRLWFVPEMGLATMPYVLVLWERPSSLPDFDLGQISRGNTGEVHGRIQGRYMETKSLLLRSRTPSGKAAGAASAVATRSLF